MSEYSVAFRGASREAMARLLPLRDALTKCRHIAVSADIERQNARLRCTLAERGIDGAFRAGHSAALGIALNALTGDEFTRARQLITDAILREVDSLP